MGGSGPDRSSWVAETGVPRTAKPSGPGANMLIASSCWSGTGAGVAVGAGLDDVGPEREPVDNSCRQSGSEKVWPNSLKHTL